VVLTREGTQAIPKWIA